jgi:N-acetylneuraminate lyase
MKNAFWIDGIVPAVYTPMKEDGTLNLDMVPKIVEHLIADKVSALYVCGSTGEGPSLSSEERKAVATAYIQAAAGQIPVIIQVGHNSLLKAQELASHAKSEGADAISAVPPTYFKPGSLEILMACLSEIASGAPDLPFYYYHIPRLTVVKIDVLQMLKYSNELLPSLAGIKYSNYTVYELQACSEYDGGRFNMLFGSDEMLLSGLIGGAQGAVGSTYNFAAPLYNKIIKTFKSGDIDEARNLQSLSIKMIHVLNKFGTPTSNAPSLKATMKLIGLDCGPMRLPQVGLSVGEIEKLKTELEAIGFFDWGR